MPNLIDGNGLTTATQQELLDFLTAKYQQIYGPNIDLSSSSQDGQMTNIFIQVTLDVEDIVATAYSARDINQAVGTQLDTLVYWIQRLGGDFTIQPITIVFSQAVTIYGLDQTVQPIFTIADSAGNQYELVTTYSAGGPGSVAGLIFQAVDPGAVQSDLNTITVPVTIVLGVSSINNPTTWTTLGINAETDASFRLRALASVSIASQGFFNALFSGLRNITGETKTVLYENYLDTVSPNSATIVPDIPPHCMWAIVQGTGDPAVIAQNIYNQRSLGCNMKGEQTYDIVQADGSIFTVQWDNAVEEDIFIQFTATSIDGINPPKIADILEQLPLLLTPAIGATVNINQVQAAVQQIDPNTLVTNAGISLFLVGPYTSTLTPTAANNQFQFTSANIYITPIILLPESSDVVPTTGTVQFTAYGGTQSFTYSISVNNSGGSIDGTTGLYTAGAATGTDTILATDDNSNTATAEVVVS